MKIKEKVLKEVLEQKWVFLDGKLSTNKVVEDAIDKTLAEVKKVIDKKIKIRKKENWRSIWQDLEKLKKELGI